MLIDYDTIFSQKKIRKIRSKPKTTLKNYNTALLLKVNNKSFSKISNLPKGNERFNFFFSPEFENDIIFSDFCLFNKTKELCYVEDRNNISEILNVLEDTLPHSITIWTKINTKQDNFEFVCRKMCENGFIHPYIKGDFLILNRKNTKNVKNESTQNMIWNKIKSLLSNSTESCDLFARLSSDAVEYLSTLSEKGHTKNKDGSLSQKEMTGDLIIRDAIQTGNRIIYEIDVNHSSIASGEEELVNVNRTRYNFHSHPREAYIRHSVHKAWPSIVDFNGLLDLGIETIFHCVATIEGVYVMSFSKFWHSRVQDIDKEFVNKNFDIDHKKEMTPYQYVEKVNNIKLKNHPIFHLWFFEWNKATTPFKIEYAPIDGVCFVNQESFNFHKKNFS